jgi:hypothetical protein
MRLEAEVGSEVGWAQWHRRTARQMQMPAQLEAKHLRSSLPNKYKVNKLLAGCLHDCTHVAEHCALCKVGLRLCLLPRSEVVL